MRPAAAVPAVLWAAASGAWLGQVFLPWTSRGPLSRATPLEAGALRHDGVLGSVPASVGWLIVLVPAVAAILLVTVPLSGRAWRVLRSVLAGIASAILLVILASLTRAEPDRFGPGAWLALAGVLLAVGAFASSVVIKENR
ncbi:hypothetical protein [Nocardioides sp. AE5]|uniref:hypothetical protein n=1 Tax=Nocardioides sp. AE5 TaxID=2962573 RepID=UPI0028827DCD|nr:hypothetical protein [Nocardioides sp. AE5]MDT0200402.1 hypothetical protein [Nocardioides sp. AE5]